MIVRRIMQTEIVVPGAGFHVEVDEAGFGAGEGRQWPTAASPATPTEQRPG